MAGCLSESDRNTEWFDAPSDGPDAECCLMCGDPVKPGDYYCSKQCAIEAEND